MPRGDRLNKASLREKRLDGPGSALREFVEQNCATRTCGELVILQRFVCYLLAGPGRETDGAILQQRVTSFLSQADKRSKELIEALLDSVGNLRTWCLWSSPAIVYRHLRRSRYCLWLLTR